MTKKDLKVENHGNFVRVISNEHELELHDNGMLYIVEGDRVVAIPTKTFNEMMNRVTDEL